MESIPTDIRTWAERQPGEVVRTAAETDRAADELQKLGLKRGSEAFDFLERFCVCTFSSAAMPITLLDVAEPTPQISTASEFVRATWSVPEEMIALSSPEGEGCVLLSRADGTIYDFFLAKSDALRNPRWSTYYEFLREYFSSER